MSLLYYASKENIQFNIFPAQIDMIYVIMRLSLLWVVHPFGFCLSFILNHNKLIPFAILKKRTWKIFKIKSLFDRFYIELVAEEHKIR